MTRGSKMSKTDAKIRKRQNYGVMGKRRIFNNNNNGFNCNSKKIGKTKRKLFHVQKKLHRINREWENDQGLDSTRLQKIYLWRESKIILSLLLSLSLSFFHSHTHTLTHTKTHTHKLKHSRTHTNTHTCCLTFFVTC